MAPFRITPFVVAFALLLAGCGKPGGNTQALSLFQTKNEANFVATGAAFEAWLIRAGLKLDSSQEKAAEMESPKLGPTVEERNLELRNATQSGATSEAAAVLSVVRPASSGFNSTATEPMTARWEGTYWTGPRHVWYKLQTNKGAVKIRLTTNAQTREIALLSTIDEKISAAERQELRKRARTFWKSAIQWFQENGYGNSITGNADKWLRESRERIDDYFADQ